MKQYFYLCICIIGVYGCGSGSENDQSGTLDIRQIQQPRTFVGEFRMDSSGTQFVECQTQTSYPIVGGEGLNLMKKTFLSMGLEQGTVVLAEFVGYIAQQFKVDTDYAERVVMVNSFINIDPVLDCGDIGISISQDSLYLQITRELENISYMYQDSVLMAGAIQPGMQLTQILASEPMEMAFQAYLMAKGGLSRREVMEQSDSLQTVMDVYELLKKR